MDSPRGSLWLHLSDDRSGGYWHVRGRLLVQRDPSKPGDEGLRNTDDADAIEVFCLMSADVRGGWPYGWSVGYRSPYFVEVDGAERMAKRLRGAARRMEAASRRLGQPGSFSEYVVRVGEALGVAGYCVARNVSSWHTETDWHRMDGATARYWIDRRVAELRAEMGFGAESAA